MANDLHQRLTDTVSVGSFPVRMATAECMLFLDLLRDMGESDAKEDMPVHLPPTAPVRWLAMPEVRLAIEQVVESKTAFMLVRQEYEYTHPLHPDRDYRLRVGVRRSADIDKELIIIGTVEDIVLGTLAVVTSVLRMIKPGRSTGK